MNKTIEEMAKVLAGANDNCDYCPDGINGVCDIKDSDEADKNSNVKWCMNCIIRRLPKSEIRRKYAELEGGE